jgi:hypothetical protein
MNEAESRAMSQQQKEEPESEENPLSAQLTFKRTRYRSLLSQNFHFPQIKEKKFPKIFISQENAHESESKYFHGS